MAGRDALNVDMLVRIQLSQLSEGVLIVSGIQLLPLILLRFQLLLLVNMSANQWGVIISRGRFVFLLGMSARTPMGLVMVSQLKLIVGLAEAAYVIMAQLTGLPVLAVFRLTPVNLSK